MEKHNYRIVKKDELTHHKYIKKYMKNGKTVYVYNDPKPKREMANALEKLGTNLVTKSQQPSKAKSFDGFVTDVLNTIPTGYGTLTNARGQKVKYQKYGGMDYRVFKQKSAKAISKGLNYIAKQLRK